MEDEKKAPETEETQVTDEKSSRSFLKWVKLGMVVAVLLGEAYGAYAVMDNYYPVVYGYLNKPPAETADNIFEITDLIVNPMIKNDMEPHFLVVSVGINLKQKEEVTKLKTREMMAKDAIITVLGNHSLNDLKNLSKRDELKREIGSVVNRVMNQNAVKDLYFTKYVIQ